MLKMHLIRYVSYTAQKTNNNFLSAITGISHIQRISTLNESNELITNIEKEQIQRKQYPSNVNKVSRIEEYLT